MKTIELYSTAYMLIDNDRPEFLDQLTQGQRETLEHVDDFESIDYLLIDGSAVVIRDMMSGDVLQIETLAEFLRHTLDYLKENI